LIFINSMILYLAQYCFLGAIYLVFEDFR
jgi:hypothetical protein